MLCERRKTISVVKRDGTRVKFDADAISMRLSALCDIHPPLRNVDVEIVMNNVIPGLADGITTAELDLLTAETSANKLLTSPEYETLAARILISNLQKQTPKTFSESTELLYNLRSSRSGAHTPRLSKGYVDAVRANAQVWDAAIKDERDFKYDFMGIQTLLKGYMFCDTKGKCLERPQYTHMRQAIEMHRDDVASALETYEALSLHLYTHGTPTISGAGSPCNQLSSCFMLELVDDSIDGIYETLKRCAIISKGGGGISVALHKLRAKGSYIASTGGRSDGIIPVLVMFGNMVKYVKQGATRGASVAMYLETWHADIFDFIKMKAARAKMSAEDTTAATKLFYALWVSDLFMKRVETNGDWSLFCPSDAPGLQLVWGDKFVELYERYENTPGLARQVVKARDLYTAVTETQAETGAPYFLFKDSFNRKSNHVNLGTLQSSNLCAEMAMFIAPEKAPICNLASIPAQRYLVAGIDGKLEVDHGMLSRIVRLVTRNLHRVMDVGLNPIPQSRAANDETRPIAIGQQGLADVFFAMNIPYESPEAFKVAGEIAETILFASLSESVELAKVHGAYQAFAGSPSSKGILQPDMWNATPSSRWPWAQLRADIVEHGLRGSHATGQMPTATTSHILGNTESFEPLTSNLYSRRIKSGEYAVLNKFLYKELVSRDMWNQPIIDSILENEGSVAHLRELPQSVRDVYKTVYEMKQKRLLEMGAAIAPFIDHSISQNIYFAKATSSALASIHMHGWRLGLKTGSYYIRTKPARNPDMVTITKKYSTTPTPNSQPEECTSCGS